MMSIEDIKEDIKKLKKEMDLMAKADVGEEIIITAVFNPPRKFKRIE